MTIGGVIVEPAFGQNTARRRLLRLRRPCPLADEPTTSRLALRAAELRRAVETGAIASAWRRASFGRVLDEIRAQIAPIEQRDTLEGSFAREAARQLEVHGAMAAATPLDLAYAVRWLELDPAGLRPIPAWADWLSAEPG